MADDTATIEALHERIEDLEDLVAKRDEEIEEKNARIDALEGDLKITETELEEIRDAIRDFAKEHAA